MGKKTSVKKYITLLILIISASIFYQVSYLRWTFYDGVMELSGLNNTQFGLTMSVYGMVSMILYLPGGIIADKFPSKILIPVSMLLTGISSLLLMTGPAFGIQVVIYVILAIAGTLTFWASLVKATKELDDGDGSKMLGLLEGGRGVFQTVLSYVFLCIFGLFASAIGGIKAVLLGYGVLNILFGMISFFLLGNNSRETEETFEPLRASDVLRIIKMPAVWLLALVIISCYSVHLGGTYLTPYFTNVIGATAVLSGVFAIIRNYVAQMGGAPLGGMLASKTKSSSLIVACAYVVMVVGIVIIVVLPANSSMMIPLIVAMILTAVTIYVMRGIYFAIIGECGIPDRLTGTAVGVVSIIGFSPDIFMNTICGSLLDQYKGVQGYHYIFIIMLIFALVGLAASWTLYFGNYSEQQ